jgi:glycosyltransferase involved in cell wall biosynthesis
VTRLTHTIAALVGAGDEVLVVAPAARRMPDTYAGAQVIGARSTTMPFYPSMRLGLPLPSRRQARTLARFAPDLIHAVNPVALGLKAFSFAHRLHVPLVASYHAQLAAYTRRYHLSLLEGTAWAYLRGLHNRAQLNLCTSHPVEKELQLRGFHHVVLWEPGVDANLFRPDRGTAEWRARLTGGHPEATIILTVGRLAMEKHLEVLAPALAQLEGCHVSLVGAGPAEERLRTTFAGLPATFVGPLYGSDLAAAYASADVFAFPSTTETLGLVALEAMAAGLPVVGARSGGLPDLVADGETGLLFDPGADEDFTRQLGALVGDAALRRRLGTAGRHRAEGWSWERTTAGLRARYAAVVNGGQAD